MTNTWWDVREEDLNLVLTWTAVRDFREDILKTLESAAHAAGAYMAANVPFHSGQLYHAINVGSIVYRPGGAGGGGRYEVEVGVDRDRAPHAEFVIEGTGIYNRENPRNGIYAHSPGKPMYFEKRGEIVFTMWTRGQEPQRAWFENAQDVAQEIIEHAVRHGVR